MHINMTIICAALAFCAVTATQNCSSEPNATFPHDFSGWRCPGLQQVTKFEGRYVNDSASCAAACCNQTGCDIYQWCPANSMCASLTGGTGGICAIGNLSTTGPEACVADSGWQSRSRTASGPPRCREDEDCMLNGACSSSSGECSCNPGWTGPDCGQLDLLPVKLTEKKGRKGYYLPLAYGAYPTDSTPGLSSWGGSIVKDPHTPNLYHLFAGE